MYIQMHLFYYVCITHYILEYPRGVPAPSDLPSQQSKKYGAQKAALIPPLSSCCTALLLLYMKPLRWTYITVVY